MASNRDLTWGWWLSDSLMKRVNQLNVWREAVIHELIVKSVIHSFFSIIVHTPQGKQGNYLPQKQHTTFHLERWNFYSCSVCDTFVDYRKPASVEKKVNSVLLLFAWWWSGPGVKKKKATRMLPCSYSPATKRCNYVECKWKDTIFYFAFSFVFHYLVPLIKVQDIQPSSRARRRALRDPTSPLALR